MGTQKDEGRRWVMGGGGCGGGRTTAAVDLLGGLCSHAVPRSAAVPLSVSSAVSEFQSSAAVSGVSRGR